MIPALTCAIGLIVGAISGAVIATRASAAEHGFHDVMEF
jgi:hypothetical protein